MDGGVHIAGVADVHKSISLRDLERLLDVHGRLGLDLSRLLELLAGLGSHYYQGASFGKGQQGFVVLSELGITFIIFALKSTFRFLGGISVIV